MRSASTTPAPLSGLREPWWILWLNATLDHTKQWARRWCSCCCLGFFRRVSPCRFCRSTGERLSLGTQHTAQHAPKNKRHAPTLHTHLVIQDKDVLGRHLSRSSMRNYGWSHAMHQFPCATAVGEYLPTNQVEEQSSLRSVVGAQGDSAPEVWWKSCWMMPTSSRTRSWSSTRSWFDLVPSWPGRPTSPSQPAAEPGSPPMAADSEESDPINLIQLGRTDGGWAMVSGGYSRRWQKGWHASFAAPSLHACLAKVCGDESTVCISACHFLKKTEQLFFGCSPTDETSGYTHQIRNPPNKWTAYRKW